MRKDIDDISFINDIPSKRLLRRMGLIKDQEGIFQRYRYESENWEIHLNNTKQFITECLETSGATKVSILGSGWLFDIPVEFLEKRFNKVTFYDVRHPYWVRKKYAGVSNFHFIATDLTGGLLETVLNLCSRSKRKEINNILDELNIPDFKLPETDSYIISVNLLNQLDILILDYIQRFCKIEKDLEKKLRSSIQKAHLKVFKPDLSCLITDYEEIHIDDEGEIIDKIPLMFCALPSGKYRKTWTWNFDTHKSYNPKYNTLMNVVAIKF